MSEPTKALRIFATTHTVLKTRAAAAKVSMQDYMRNIIEGEPIGSEPKKTTDAQTQNQDIPDN